MSICECGNYDLLPRLYNEIILEKAFENYYKFYLNDYNVKLDNKK